MSFPTGPDRTFPVLGLGCSHGLMSEVGSFCHISGAIHSNCSALKRLICFFISSTTHSLCNLLKHWKVNQQAVHFRVSNTYLPDVSCRRYVQFSLHIFHEDLFSFWISSYNYVTLRGTFHENGNGTLNYDIISTLTEPHVCCHKTKVFCFSVYLQH